VEPTRIARPGLPLWLPDRRRTYELLELGASSDGTSRLVDKLLISTILISLVATVVESVPSLEPRWHDPLFAIEVVAVALFSCEYVLRVICAVERPEPRYHHPIWGRLRFALSPLAMADLLAVLPFYLGAFLPLDLRMLRLLRLLRILKLTHYFSALGTLLDVVRMERHALLAAYFVVAVGIILASTGIYIFEHEAQPDAFSSVPAAIYWSIITLSTVGYGDVVPVTTGGRAMSVLVIMLGVGTLTVPTGIMATGFVLELQRRRQLGDDEDPAPDGRCPTCGR
jgi:voltage-gated potassium channel